MKRLGGLLLIVLLACGSGWAAGPKEGVGALLGAGTGALIGSTIGDGSGQVAAVVIGTLAGALVGQNVGYQLDRADRLSMQANAQQTLEYSRTNQASDWVNPDTGHAGSTTPLRTYRTSSGQYCREYQQTVIIAGQQQQAYGTACRQPDGSWQTVAPKQAQQPVEVRQVVKKVRYVDPYDSYYPRSYYSPYRFFVNFSYIRGHHKHYGQKHHYRGHHYKGHHYKGHHKKHYRGHHKKYSKGRHYKSISHSKKYRGNRWGHFEKRHRRR